MTRALTTGERETAWFAVACELLASAFLVGSAFAGFFGHADAAIAALTSSVAFDRLARWSA